MAFVLFNLLLAGAPPWLIWNLAETTPAPAVQATAQVIVRSGDKDQVEEHELVIVPVEGEEQGLWVAALDQGDGEGAVAGNVTTGSIQLVRVGDPDDATTGRLVVQAVAGDAAAAGSQPRMIVMHGEPAADGRSDAKPRTALVRVAPKVDAQAEADRGWLGVSVGEMSGTLAAQLGTEGNGAVIINVVADSPADKAGFQAHDIVVSINGEAVEGETGKTVDLIRSRKPGDAIAVEILRDGQPRTLNVTLGSRADMPAQAFAWKFETTPEGQVEESVRTRGKFIAKDPSGQWIVRDLGDLSTGGVLPDNVRMILPRSGERTTTVTVEDGKKVIKTEVSRDGSSIAVQREGEGPITVERTDADGNKTEADYETEDELQTADAEAYELFKQSGGVAMFHIDGGNLFQGGHLFDGNFDFKFDFDPGEWQEAVKGWHEGMEAQVGEAKEAYQKAMEELHAALENANVQGKLGDVKGLMKLRQLEPGQIGFMHAGKARQSFEVRPDGTIEFRTRKGDSELVELYKNEADLKKRNSELYEKFQDLRSTDDE